MKPIIFLDADAGISEEQKADMEQDGLRVLLLKPGSRAQLVFPPASPNGHANGKKKGK